jgi:hypothetical protein
MYDAVPSTDPTAVRLLAAASRRAMPKSVSTSVPFGRTRRFAGFTSRCTMPLSCAACRASAACAIRDIVRCGVSRPTWDSVLDSASPSTYSMTRYVTPASAP